MFSKKELEFIKNPLNFNRKYRNTLRCRVREKVNKCVDGLLVYVQLKTVFGNIKYDSLIIRKIHEINDLV